MLKSYKEVQRLERRWEVVALMGNLQAIKVLHKITGDEIHISPLS